MQVLFQATLNCMGLNRFNMSALRLINETTGTSTSSFQVTDIFSSDFDIYKLVVDRLDLGNANYARIKFINSAGSLITGGYETAFLDLTSYAVYAENRATNQTDLALGYAGGTTTAWGGGFVIYVINPYQSSTYTFVEFESSTNISANFVGSKGIGLLQTQVSVTGIEFHLASSGIYDNIRLRTYGLSVV